MTDLLDLVAAALPPELVRPDSMHEVGALARILPTARAIGFECRLTGALDVDVQVSANADHGEPAALARFLRTQANPSPAWRRVAKLCEQWTEPGGSVDEAVAELWFEFDSPGPVESRGDLADVIPSVFATLATPASAATRLAGAEAVVGCLAEARAAAGLVAFLRRCDAACAGPSRLSHVGVMLGRDVEAGRVHVSGVPLDRMSEYLSAVGWAGDIAHVRELAGHLLTFGEFVVLCFDVLDGRVVPRLGLECGFTQKSGVDPRWENLLKRLVELGLAAPERAAVLPGWPAVLTPMQAPEGWPDDLLVESLAASAGRFGIIERRLSHVKLTWAADAPVQAKAYFGGGHVWQQLDPPRRPREPERPVRRPPGSDTLDAATTAAVGWLLAARDQGGWWRDFFDRARPAHVERTAGYASDEWVTAYVAAALAAHGGDGARQAADNALRMLLVRWRTAPGWGFHAFVPADADSTTWVLRVASALGATDCEALARGRDFVAGLVGEDAAVRTYPASAVSSLAGYTGVDTGYPGWCGPHPCVTAAAAALDLHPGLRAYLRRVQRSDGSWSGYWWDDDEYTTAHAAEALRRYDDDAARRAASWAAGRVDRDGSVRSAGDGRPSPYATALAVRAVLADPTPNVAERHALARASRWLIDAQRADGSWEPSARLRIPPPDAVDPLAAPDRTLIYVDEEATFTTATVLSALSALARQPDTVGK